MARFLVGTVGLTAELMQLGLAHSSVVDAQSSGVLFAVGLVCSAAGLWFLGDSWADRLMSGDPVADGD